MEKVQEDWICKLPFLFHSLFLCNFSLKDSANSTTYHIYSLVNNAGIADFSGGIANESLKTFEREMAVNTRGTYIGCQQAVRQMLKQSPRALPADSELDLDDIPFESLEKGGSEVELRKSYKEDEETPITSGRLGEEALDGEKDVGARGSRGVIINIGSIHGLM